MPDLMSVYVAVVSFCFGSVLGSFFGLAAVRLPSGKSVVRPGSYCDSCGHELRLRDLVPILSWLVLRGRCRYCGAKIPAWYFGLELACGAAAAAVVLQLRR